MVAESFDERRGAGTSFLLQEVLTVAIKMQRRMINNLFMMFFKKFSWFKYFVVFLLFPFPAKSPPAGNFYFFVYLF